MQSRGLSRADSALLVISWWLAFTNLFFFIRIEFQSPHAVHEWLTGGWYVFKQRQQSLNSFGSALLSIRLCCAIVPGSPSSLCCLFCVSLLHASLNQCSGIWEGKCACQRGICRWRRLWAKYLPPFCRAHLAVPDFRWKSKIDHLMFESMRRNFLRRKKTGRTCLEHLWSIPVWVSGLLNRTHVLVRR